MSFPALTAALLLGGVPVNPAGTPPAALPHLAYQAETDQVAQAPAAPPVQLELPPAEARTGSAEPEPAAPVQGTPATDPSAPGPSTPAPAPSSGAPDSGAGKDVIVVTGRPKDPGDPFEDINAESYKVTQAVDRAVIGPVALAYQDTIPSPIRKGIRNFLNNLGEAVVFVNFLLQLKPGKAMETLGRFAINSTLGIAGVVDAAKRAPFGLPRRSNGFANTMGYYGIKAGPYFFLPLVGATTLRDLIGNGLDRLVFPTLLGKPFNNPKYVIPAWVIRQLDDRAEFNEQMHVLRDQSPDPYAAMRKYYLECREAEIEALRGKRDDATHPASMPALTCR